MTNEQILKKAIDKAIKNGWELHFWGGDVDEIMENFDFSKSNIHIRDYYRFIFSHDFAKAFWGEDEVYIKYGDKKGNYITLERWQHELQQMVLEKNPLKYIERFL